MLCSLSTFNCFRKDQRYNVICTQYIHCINILSGHILFPTLPLGSPLSCLCVDDDMVKPPQVSHIRWMLLSLLLHLLLRPQRQLPIERRKKRQMRVMWLLEHLHRLGHLLIFDIACAPKRRCPSSFDPAWNEKCAEPVSNEYNVRINEIIAHKCFTNWRRLFIKSLQ